MARLTSAGIVFSDNTSLNSKYGIVPQTATALFLQASAPVGWTQSTAHNDKTLRVVSGTGGGSGGTSAFTSVFPNSLRSVSASIPVSGSVGAHTLNITQLPSHGHGGGGSLGLSPGGGDVGSGGGWNRSFPGYAFNGGGGAHAHPWSGSFNFSVNLDFRVQYVDVIICSFA